MSGNDRYEAALTLASRAEERMEDRFRQAVNAECSCGGSYPGCMACRVWHRYMNRPVPVLDEERRKRLSSGAYRVRR